MSLRRTLEAMVGRRLLVRIWLHGILLFAGILATLFVARFVLPGHDAPAAVFTARPYLAFGLLLERALAQHDRPEALAREVRAIHEQLHFDITVFRANGTLLATSTDPPLAPLSANERRALQPQPGFLRSEVDSWGRRFIVGAFEGDGLVAYAVGSLPALSRHLRQGLPLLLAAVVLSLVFVAIPLSSSIARPLEELGRLSRELGEGNLTVRAHIQRHDEIGALARAFNDMAGRVQRLRYAERELLADVSHELRTPLARMRVVLELASDAQPDNMRRYLREIATDLSEIEQLLADIIASSRLEFAATRWQEARAPLRLQAVEMKDLVEAATRRFRERWPNRELLCRVPDQDLVVEGDPVVLRRVVDNLIDNAHKYSPQGKPIALLVERSEIRGSPGVRVDVVDEGVGIAPDDQDRVFTSFFRADKSRNRATGGVGLGLALARRIVEAHGGVIGLRSERGLGSRFWFVLPLARQHGIQPGPAHPAVRSRN
jgi:two-component system OmpR family sensor kinase